MCAHSPPTSLDHREKGEAFGKPKNAFLESSLGRGLDGRLIRESVYVYEEDGVGRAEIREVS